MRSHRQSFDWTTYRLPAVILHTLCISILLPFPRRPEAPRVRPQALPAVSKSPNQTFDDSALKHRFGSYLNDGPGNEIDGKTYSIRPSSSPSQVSVVQSCLMPLRQRKDRYQHMVRGLSLSTLCLSRLYCLQASTASSKSQNIPLLSLDSILLCSRPGAHSLSYMRRCILFVIITFLIAWAFWTSRPHKRTHSRSSMSNARRISFIAFSLV